MNHRDAEAYIPMARRRKRAEERRVKAVADKPRLPDASVATWKPAAGLDHPHQTVLINA